jgi:predicted ester cyclase
MIRAALLFTLALSACGASEPPKEQLVAVAEKFYGAFNAGDKQQFLDLTADGFTDHMTSPRPDDGGKGAIAYAVEAFKQGYPDLHIAIDQTWQDGATLVVFTRVTGTNTGPLFGSPPTGKAVQFSTLDALGIENGKLKDLWHIEQQHQMFQQLQQQ